MLVKDMGGGTKNGNIQDCDGRDPTKVGSLDWELYAMLHLSPEALDDDVKNAYRQWAQVYDPDKHQRPQVC